MTTIFNTAKIKVNETPRVNEYRLMYLWGAWVTKKVIYAECDAEAIHDANEAFAGSRLDGWRYGVALFCGNRKVKQYA